jgi:hypothetical protein
MASPSLADGGTPTWASCTTNAGFTTPLEGRCIPRGLAVIPASKLRIGQETCPSDFVCTPCFDPVDGYPTGACNSGGDHAKEPPPPPLKPCGAFDGGVAGGLCVPESATSTWGGQLRYKQDECAAGDVCAPVHTVTQPGNCFERCTTTLATLGEQYGPGACLPSYYVRDTNPVGLVILTAGTCLGAGDLCSPCLDPLNNGAPSGTCQ